MKMGLKTLKEFVVERGLQEDVIYIEDFIFTS